MGAIRAVPQAARAAFGGVGFRRTDVAQRDLMFLRFFCDLRAVRVYAKALWGGRTSFFWHSGQVRGSIAHTTTRRIKKLVKNHGDDLRVLV